VIKATRPRSVAGEDVAEVVRAQVHPAEADQRPQERRREDYGGTRPPRLECEHGELGQHPIHDEGLHRVPAREAVAALDQQRMLEESPGWGSLLGSGLLGCLAFRG
jgi:hypothetical protein